MIKVETFLRIRPLDNKYKLKQDYYTVYPRGLPEELKNPDMPKSITGTSKQILVVQGHPLAGSQSVTPAA